MEDSKKVYAIDNPMWVTDTFIFAKGDDFNSFIKINIDEQIEEIGVDIVKRMQCYSFEDLLENKNVREATDSQAKLYKSIGNDYFWHIYNKDKLLNKLNKGYLLDKIAQATPKLKDLDADKFLEEIRGSDEIYYGLDGNAEG